MEKSLEYEIIRKVRHLYRTLAETGDALLKPLGLTGADRAVLEILYPDLAMTVPQMARRFQVSRQHIQTTANRLLERGLLIKTDNPDHSRSVLMRLSTAGQTQFAAIGDLERDITSDIFEGIPAAEKIITERTLGMLLTKANQRSGGN